MLISSSCNKVKQVSLKPSLTSLDKDITIEAAKHIDTPTPVGFSLTHVTKNEGLSIFHYQGKLPSPKVIEFYRCDMERLGWALIDFSSNKHGLLVCHKGTRYCAITVEATNNASYPTNIILHIKEHRHEQKDFAISTQDINSKQLIPLILTS